MIKFNNLSLRYMKQHKKRNLFIIIGISLAIALITAMTTLFDSLRAEVVKRDRAAIGEYHLLVKNMPHENLKFLGNNKVVERIGLVRRDGNSKNNNINFFSGDDNFFRILSPKIDRGDLPKNNDEIAISKDAAEKINKSFKLNESLTMNGKAYKIVGFLEDEIKMTAYTWNNNLDKEDKVDAYLTIDESLKVRDEISRLQENSFKEYETEVNTHLLEYMDKMVISNLNTDVLWLIVYLYILLAIATTIIIYNIFNISIVERIRDFGLLRAVGATGKQIRRMVLKEGAVIASISIVMGVLSGIGLVKAAIIVLSRNPYSLAKEIEISIDYRIILLSVVLGIINIYLSLIVPAIKAFKITPLDAMNGNSGIANEKIKKVNRGKLARLIFKGEGFIASKNIRRKKWRFRMSVTSIAISIILFIVSQGVVNILVNSDAISGARSLTNMNIGIYSAKDKNGNSFKNISNEVLKRDYAEKIVEIYKPTEGQVTLKSDKVGADLDKDFKLNEEKGNATLKAKIEFYNDQFLKTIDEYLQSGSGKNFELGSNNVIIYQNPKEAKGEFQEKRILEYTKLQVGDSITIKDKEFKVAGILKRHPITNGGDYGDTITVLGGEELLNLLYSEDNSIITSLFIKLKEDKDNEGAKLDIENLCREYPFVKYKDMDAKMKEFRRGAWEVVMMLYIFIGIIALIATLNIINSIVTGILTRKKEFAALAAIGMSNRGINKVVLLEGLLQCIVAWIYGTVIGLGVYYTVAKLMSRATDLVITIPFKSIIISLIAIIIIAMIAIYVPIRCLKKMNIIEGLRLEE